MIVRIPTPLVQSIRQVQEIQRGILEPFAELRARLTFPVEVIQLKEQGARSDTCSNVGTGPEIDDDPNPEETRE